MAEDTPSIPSSVTGIFQRKVFGVPVMLLAALFAAGLLWYAIRLKPSEDATEDVDGDDMPEGDLPDMGSSTPIFIARDIPTDDDNPDIPDQPAAERSDADWARDAIQWLIAGGASTSTATNAINKYLAGDALSQGEGVLRDKALRQFGPPPSGYQTSSTLKWSGPAARQGNPPTKHTVKSKNDDTPRELARLYYGMETVDAVRYIQSQNTSLPTPYPRGSVVNIPKFRTPKYFRATKRVDTMIEIARKNGTTAAAIAALNPGLKFPVKDGTRVRVQ